jgi:dolichol-phosphate mannosyltransferase
MPPPLILIPTYNERENVALVSRAVFAALPEAHILFIDDNSPDGTGARIEELRQGEPRLHVLHRTEKAGLGRAYIAGFRWLLARDYPLAICMDADLSHDPADLPAMVAAAENADLVCGSRYKDGIRIMNWPLSRLLLSKGASWYTTLLTGMPFTDPTGGFNAYRRSLLERLPLDRIQSNGYSFQIEMKHSIWISGYRWTEVPITFTERRSGISKMNPAIVREALCIVWRLVIRQGFRRTPRAQVQTT